MKPDLLSGIEAAAMGAKLAKVEMVPNFPMPFVYKMAEKLSGCNVIDVESQSSAVTAAIAATACEKRSFLAINAVQAFQEFYNAALMRIPIVAAGTTTTMRDIGWLIFAPASNQEILDTVIQAYRVCEDNNVLLPGFVYLDMPELREPIFVPKEQSVKGFLPNLRLHNKIDVKKPMIIDAIDNQEKKVQQQKAMENALKLIQKLEDGWKKKFKRSYGLIENYCMDDAEDVLVITGSDSLTAKVVIDKLRADGEKVGMLRLRVIRPLPVEEIRNSLKDVKHVAVIDKEVSIGSSGVLYKDIKECYNGLCSNFIIGRLNESDIVDIFKQIKGLDKSERFWFI